MTKTRLFGIVVFIFVIFMGNVCFAHPKPALNEVVKKYTANVFTKWECEMILTKAFINILKEEATDRDHEIRDNMIEIWSKCKELP